MLLNLDLVATVELAPQSDLLSSGGADSRKVYATFLAPDKTAIATLHFDSSADATAWVEANLGLKL